MRTFAAIAAFAVVLALAPVAQAKRPHRSDRLWATVNVCDTAAHPNEIGVRASMPGLKRRTTMQMRFRIQYLAAADDKWHNFVSNPDTDSGWTRAGRQRGGAVESGYNVTFKPPAGGGMHRLRGAVYFRWLRKGHSVHRLRRLTEAGHRSTEGSDPPGYSAAFCEIT